MTYRPLPWSASCFVCGDANPKGIGGKFVVDEHGVVRLEATIDGAFEGYGGHIHGGVITALLDEAAGWACSVVNARFCRTVRITVTFRQPVPTGQVVVVEGEAVGSGTRLLRGKARMTDAEGRVLATAEGLFAPVPEDVHREVIEVLKMPGRPATTEDV